MNRILGLVYLSAFLFINSLYADEGSDARTSMYYLKSGIGARASGMGNAFVAVSNDVSSVYWNPAELSNLENTNIQFTGMYAIPASNSHYLFGAVAQRLKNNDGGIGLYWHNFIIGNLNSSSRNHIFGISYGRSLISILRLGIGVKYYYQIINKNKFDSFGFDIAGTIQLTGSLLKLSGSIADLGSSSLTDLTIRAGASYPFLYNFLLASVDLSKTVGKKLRPHIGFEITPITNYYFINKLNLRFGFDDYNFSSGLGFIINRYTFDYSYTNNSIHKFSLTIIFQ